jgi:hypothetical protein
MYDGENFKVGRSHDFPFHRSGGIFTERGTDQVSDRGYVPGCLKVTLVPRYCEDKIVDYKVLLVFRRGVKKCLTFVSCVCRVVISRMYIMDNILSSTKKEIINNFPIESTHPPCSTHGGNFELRNTSVYIVCS